VLFLDVGILEQTRQLNGQQIVDKEFDGDAVGLESAKKRLAPQLHMMLHVEAEKDISALPVYRVIGHVLGILAKETLRKSSGVTIASSRMA